MTKQSEKTGLALILLIIILSGCVNLKYVNDFSTSSQKGLKQFEEITYSFKQYCLDTCYDYNISNLNLTPKECECKSSEEADKVTLLIYHAALGYIDGLTSLSNKDLTSYKMDALTKALTAGNFGTITIDKKQADAYKSIADLLLRAFTDKYRNKKIKAYVKEANEPFKVLIFSLDFNLSQNLSGILDAFKEGISSDFFTWTRKDSTLSNFEKRIITKEYYQQLEKIEIRQKELQTYSKTLKKIGEGHQKLADNVDKLSNDEIKRQLFQYASDIKDIISEFNKLKK
jgi:hypothetical protein